MKNKILFFLSFLLAIQLSVNAQTVFWSDNFDAPSGGSNNNNAGVGWILGGSLDYDDEGESIYGIPFGFYNIWKKGTSGVCISGNKLYVGNNYDNTNAYISDNIADVYALSSNISTISATGMSLKFSWRCNGETTDYGEVGLSKDGGTTWTWLSKKYVNQNACTNESITIPQDYEGITNFKIGFGFHSHATSCAFCDPPFNVDDIQLTCTTCPSGGGCSAGTIAAVRDTICAETTPALLSVTGSSGNIQWQSSAISGGTYMDIPGVTTTSYTAPSLSQTTYYKVKATNGSCTDISPTPKAIIVNPSPVADFTFTISGTNQVTFTNTSTGATNYNWDFGDGTTSSATNPPAHTYTNDSTRKVCLAVTNGSNCSFTVCRDVVVTSIATIKQQNIWKVYPEPFTNNLFIQSDKNSKDIRTIEISDLLGRIVFAKNFSNTHDNTLQINLVELVPGMYYLKIKTDTANYIQSVIKQ